jgi:hypothetical protein
VTLLIEQDFSFALLNSTFSPISLHFSSPEDGNLPVFKFTVFYSENLKKHLAIGLMFKVSSSKLGTSLHTKVYEPHKREMCIVRAQEKKEYMTLFDCLKNNMICGLVYLHLHYNCVETYVFEVACQR